MQTHKLPILLSRNTVKHAVGYSNAGYDINRRSNRHTGANPNTNNTGTQHKDTQPYGHSNIHTCMHAWNCVKAVDTTTQEKNYPAMSATQTDRKHWHTLQTTGIYAHMHSSAQVHKQKEQREHSHTKRLQPTNTIRRNIGIGTYKHTATHPQKHTTM